MSSVVPYSSIDLQGQPCDLRCAGVAKRYKDFALQAVSLAVPHGSVVGLIGRNGAGKTTLMRILLGSLAADAGRVELLGQDVGALSHNARATLRQDVAFVAAVTAYPAVMTVTEVATMYQLAYPVFGMDAFRELATRLGLLPYSEHKQVRELSRGTGMKLQLACALASGARLVVMDEPTAGLDPIARDELLDVLRAWMEPGDRSLLISSHITSDLEKLADYLVVLDEGRVIAELGSDSVERMGIARLRTPELEQVLADGHVARGQARVLHEGLSWNLLVPDRAAFGRSYPEYVCDRATIDDCLVLLVKGEVR